MHILVHKLLKLLLFSTFRTCMPLQLSSNIKSTSVVRKWDNSFVNICFEAEGNKGAPVSHILDSNPLRKALLLMIYSSRSRASNSFL